MERLTKVWNSLRAMLLRAVRERKSECLTVGAGTAVVIAAVGSLMGSKPMIVKQMGEITVTQEASGQKEEESDTGDDDPDGTIPCGYAGVIDGILATKGLTKSYRAVGGPCETVLVGQWMIRTETVAKLDVGTRMIQALEAADQETDDLTQQMRMSDKDYENLLAIVEAEAG